MDGTVYCGNLGDSRIIIASKVNGKYTVEALTNDHNPDVPEERNRIEAMGGKVY
jgi:serine/threonine protein phosphatase PrpC